MLTLYDVNIAGAIFTRRHIKYDVKLDLKSYNSLLKFESRKLSNITDIALVQKWSIFWYQFCIVTENTIFSVKGPVSRRPALWPL